MLQFFITSLSGIVITIMIINYEHHDGEIFIRPIRIVNRLVYPIHLSYL